ncbi:YhhN-like protein [Podospora appendiculata]|uniref:YhhN-like protein n=1 Tax=Podospora appendiculata TaxID=314037 RepID=A0AAE0X200_9PEZI|nr:YhhN-like protein [Podospora appendiculata]
MSATTPTSITLDNAILALSLSSALLYGANVHSPPSITRMITKTTSTALLSALASLRGGPPLLATALALGATGDAFLAWDGDAAFLSGLGSFLVAHVLYIVLFVGAGDGAARVLAEGWRVATALGLTVVFAPTMVTLLMPRLVRELRVPILVYITAIVLMVLAALTMGDNGWVVLGALLFTVSDGILSAEKFIVSSASAHRKWMPYAVWALYYAGQLLIALGFSSGRAV